MEVSGKIDLNHYLIKIWIEGRVEESSKMTLNILIVYNKLTIVYNKLIINIIIGILKDG